MHHPPKRPVAAARHPHGVPPPLRQAHLPLRLRRPHESPALLFTESGRTKTMTLTAGEADQVAAAVARYRDAKAALDASADAGLAILRAVVAARRGGPRP